jgi:hypothetical protein
MLDIAFHLFELNDSVFQSLDIILSGLELFVVLLNAGINVNCEIFFESFDLLNVHQLIVKVLLILASRRRLLRNTAVVDCRPSDGLIGDKLRNSLLFLNGSIRHNVLVVLELLSCVGPLKGLVELFVQMITDFSYAEHLTFVCDFDISFGGIAQGLILFEQHLNLGS